MKKVLMVICEILIGIISYCSSLIAVGLIISYIPSLTHVDPKTGEAVFSGLGGLLVLFIPLNIAVLCIVFFHIILKTKDSRCEKTKDFRYSYQQASKPSPPAPFPSAISSSSDSLSANKTTDTDLQQTFKKENISHSENRISSSQKENFSRSKETELNPLSAIKAMESWFEIKYQFARKNMLNAYDCQKFYNNMVKETSRLNVPLIVKVRCEQLCEEYKIKFQQISSIDYIDSLNGNEFEQWCADLLRKMTFQNIHVTGKSGDQGVDILSEKDGVKYAIQCKCYSNDLGNTPIQEVESGRIFYGCHVGVVITNRYFTKGAKELAQKTGTLLWDRDFISNRSEQHSGLSETLELPQEENGTGL